MSKQARLYAIKEIIAAAPVGRQEELRQRLKKRGFAVTQATLSRDIREMGLAREVVDGSPRYVLRSPGEVQSLRPLVGAEVVSMAANESLVVVRTLPGCAATVGEYIDVLRHPDLIGTVAGDNTVLVVPGRARNTAKILKFLKRKLIEGA